VCDGSVVVVHTHARTNTRRLKAPQPRARTLAACKHASLRTDTSIVPLSSGASCRRARERAFQEQPLGSMGTACQFTSLMSVIGVCQAGLERLLLTHSSAILRTRPIEIRACSLVATFPARCSTQGNGAVRMRGEHVHTCASAHAAVWRSSLTITLVASLKTKQRGCKPCLAGRETKE
jgi:hypothetical protein